MYRLTIKVLVFTFIIAKAFVVGMLYIPKKLINNYFDNSQWMQKQKDSIAMRGITVGCKNDAEAQAKIIKMYSLIR